MNRATATVAFLVVGVVFLVLVAVAFYSWNARQRGWVITGPNVGLQKDPAVKR